jgi:prepilin-type N-terminal cleavage/methylation domain-containing protein
MAKNFQGRGFSLIELLVAAAIFVLLMALALSSMNLVKKERLLSSSADKILDVLRLAQNKTLASEGSSSYGVHFEREKFVLFAGGVYSSAAPENQEFALVDGIVIGAVDLAGASDVVFERLSGNALNSGSVVLELESDATKNKIIYIESSGTMGFLPASSLGEGRLADSRRVRVLYSQDTKSAGTLSLYFPEHSYTYEVDYQGGLDEAKTFFAWEGTVQVGGQEQAIAIHSVEMDDSATLFCVHRDRRYNSEALEISLDGQNLLNYAADSQPSQGISVWAGEPQLQ